MSDLPKPVRARPVVAPPPPQKPAQQPSQQPTKKPVTIETLAYELREIRLFMQRSAKAKRRGGMLIFIFGAIFFAIGLLASAGLRIRKEQMQGFAALSGEPYSANHFSELGIGIFFLIGCVMLIVGGSMMYEPGDEP